MKILMKVGHPAHVHQFKHLVQKLSEKGHSVKVVSVKKEVNEYLLKKYNIEFQSIGKHKETSIQKAKNMFYSIWKVYKIAKIFNPDIFVGRGFPSFAFASKLLHKPFICFEDTEPTKIIGLFSWKFSDAIITPTCFKLNLGKNQVRINGYKEFAYLHPNYFKPDPSILKEIGISEGDKYIIIRFVSWTAYHDVKQSGISLDMKRNIVKEFSKYAKVFITSEDSLPRDLEKYRSRIPPDKIHNALFYADLFLGDAQTMSTEAAILGTPAIRCNSFVGPNDMSNFIELEQRYGLIFNYREPKKAIEKAVELLHQPNLKQEWKKKREKLLKDKIDVTAFMTWFVENYPESFQIMRENTDYQERFK